MSIPGSYANGWTDLQPPWRHFQHAHTKNRVHGLPRVHWWADRITNVSRVAETQTTGQHSTGRHCAQRTQAWPQMWAGRAKASSAGVECERAPLAGQSCDNGNLGADASRVIQPNTRWAPLMGNWRWDARRLLVTALSPAYLTASSHTSRGSHGRHTAKVSRRSAGGKLAAFSLSKRNWACKSSLK